MPRRTAIDCCWRAPGSPTATASRRCGLPSDTSTSSAGRTPTRASPAQRWPRSRRTWGSAPAASVLPLHSPIRVAEEWAVVDNLSRGRVGISFAAGWQPNDFVLEPDGLRHRQGGPAGIDRRRSAALARRDGRPCPATTVRRSPCARCPGPVRRSCPSGSRRPDHRPRSSGRARSVSTCSPTCSASRSTSSPTNIERYRTAWREAGHAGEGRVTLMMHTYLDRDADTAREVAREPMKGYLGTAIGLLRDVASAFPTFAGRGKDTDDLFASLSAEEMDQLLEVAADRYLSSSGLFGTPDDAADIDRDGIGSRRRRGRLPGRLRRRHRRRPRVARAAARKPSSRSTTGAPIERPATPRYAAPTPRRRDDSVAVTRRPSRRHPPAVHAVAGGDAGGRPGRPRRAGRRSST